MDESAPDPARHAAGWRLALTVPPAGTRRALARVDGRRLLLVARPGGGWWALDDHCRRCGAALSGNGESARPQAGIVCARCGATHDPEQPGTRGVPTMLVDDEIYVLLDA